MSQLLLIPFEQLSATELGRLQHEIRQSYWFIRNVRKGKFGQARLRHYYRQVAIRKRKLMLAGIEKRTVLDFLACCRLQCSANKQPFLPCPYCSRSPWADQSNPMRGQGQTGGRSPE